MKRFACNPMLMQGLMDPKYVLPAAPRALATPLPLPWGTTQPCIVGWRRLPKRLGAVTVGYKCH